MTALSLQLAYSVARGGAAAAMYQPQHDPLGDSCIAPPHFKCSARRNQWNSGLYKRGRHRLAYTSIQSDSPRGSAGANRVHSLSNGPLRCCPPVCTWYGLVVLALTGLYGTCHNAFRARLDAS
ncbi:hypothetical protein C2E23DRAFT_371738 [Lenzites betulinus]|nr:hypothetical protein C2E23DRAFT_371738 [Lenzites betulinus]